MENVKHKHREGKMVVLENGELKIKSTELVDIINDFRRLESEITNSKYVELRHSDFMTKIRKEIEILKSLEIGAERNFSFGSYRDKQNQERPCFELNRDGMLQMLNSESTLVRYKTIEYINKLEEQVKGQTLNTSELSLELQMFNKMFQALANNELEQKRLKAEIEKTKEEIQGIRDVVTLDTNGWRKETTSIINKIAYKLGGFEHIKPIREESYKLLNETIGVDINRRLKNKQKNMALEGVSKSKINKFNLLDIIGEDKKLLNGYISIISKMAIKYGVA